MRRSQLDTEWTSVAELARRTGGGKIFLSPLSPPMPPGLARRMDSPFGLANEQNTFNNSPYQPSPIRSIRSSTLESYIGTGSNPSDSPASSFGGGRFSNGSPDPAAFGGRVGQYGAGDIGGSRVGGFGIAGDASPALSGRRNTFAESVEYRSPSLTHALPQRGSTLDNGFGINGGAGGFNSPWQSGHFDNSGGRSSADSSGYQAGFGSSSGLIMNVASLANNSFGDIAGNGPGHRINDFGYGTPGSQQGLPSQALGGFNRTAALYNDPSSQAVLGSSVPQYNVNVAQQQQQHIPVAVPDLFDQNQARQMHNHFPAGNGQESLVPASPWGTLESPMNKRPGPFDPPHPTSTNTSIATQVQSSPWGTGLHPSESSTQVPEPAQMELLQEPSTTASPTSSSPQQGKVSSQPPVQEAAAVDPTSPKVEVLPPPPATMNESAPLSTEPTPTPTAPKSKTKQASAQQQQRPLVEPVSQIQTTSTQQVLSSPSQPAPPTPKAPWAKDDDGKRPSTATSLRQIQESEAKKAEARKAAEKEKEKAARVNVTVPGTEDIQSFTTSWGLPTSQAGKGSTSSSTVVSPTKEASSPASAAAPAVWTGAAKATSAKKTMKEIQEEEERRKKANAVAVPTPKEVGIGAAGITGARRGYAESTNKVRMRSSCV